jgi:hypothetical protein
MKRHWLDAAAIAVIFAAAFAVNHAPARFFAEADWPGVRLLYDVGDKNAYIRCGRYALVDGGAPYRDAYSEYPQLATYLFGVPFAFAKNRAEYHHFFTWMMAFCLAATYLLVSQMCATLGLSPRRGLLLLLPGALYFTLNRFDIVPALITVTALWALLKEKIPLSFGLLAAGVLMKLYPAIYVPFFAVYVYHRHGWKTLARGLGVFGVVVVALTAQLVWWTGWSNAFSPYRFQVERTSNTESLFYMLASAWPSMDSRAGQMLFFAAQFAPVLALPWLKLRRTDELLRWMAVATIAFILFMKLQSPQWMLWVAPLAALACRTKGELALAAAVDVMTYLYFPVLFDALGVESLWFVLFLILLAGLRLAFGALLIRPSRSGSSA